MTFLADGFRTRASQGAILVADEPVAQSMARLLHEEGLADLRAAAAGAGLLVFKPEVIGRMSADDAAQVCAQARAGGHWLFLQNVEKMLESEGGRRLLETICDAMAEGMLPSVVASTPANNYQFIMNALCRLVGLVPVIRLNSTGKPEGVDRINYLMLRTNDRSDTGWIVSVRYSLMSPLGDAYDSTGPEAEGYLPTMDKIHIIGGKSEPSGAFVSFKPESFQVGQQSAVFTAAEKLARRAVGRPLVPGERVEARRGLFYT